MTDTTDAALLERLHDDLARRAEAEGGLDVAYRRMDSPVGPLLLAATEVGVVRLAFDVEGHEAVLDDLATRVSPRVLRAPRRLEAAVRAVDAYLVGESRDIQVPLDLRLLTGYRREVVRALPTIGYGDTTTYARLAADTGRPRAVRAVGSACANNPLPLLLPCHRVVRSDGSEGGYRGGVEAKRALLALERGGLTRVERESGFR